jgi:hypothetical protein
METFSFMPKPGDAERLAERVARARAWWVEFSEPVGRLFCDTAHLPAAHEAEHGMAWAGLPASHGARRLPTDRPDVWLLEYEAPVERLAVEHQWMRPWMELVRANGLHGRYREAGTDRWYEF